MKEYMNYLVDLLNKACYFYYTVGTPIMSDPEYDYLYGKLKALEQQYPQFAREDSPTQRVGTYKLDNRFEAKEHPIPMLSLDNMFNYDDFVRFVGRVNNVATDVVYCVEPKIDGLSLELHYSNSVIVDALTRGDGKVGESVINNALTVRSIPKSIQLSGDVLVRGEVYMRKSVFETLNATLPEDQMFKNPRNCAAGSIKQLDPRITQERNLDFIAYFLIVNGELLPTYSRMLLTLAENGFTVPDTKYTSSVKRLWRMIQRLEETRHERDYDIDGAVVKIDDTTLWQKLGETSRAPRYMMAYKFATEEAVTTLKDVVWQVGRTGVLTPVAILDPVNVAGATVTHATLHNIEEIHRKGLTLGAKVLIRRAGDVIPEVIKPIERTKISIDQPVVCPSCSHELLEDLPRLICINPDCPDKLVRTLQYVVSRDVLDIEGLGNILIEKLIDKGVLSSLADLFTLQESDFEGIEGIGPKITNKVLSQIQRVVNGLSFDKFLLMLGIPHVGQVLAKKLAESYDSIAEIHESDLCKLEGVDKIIEAHIKQYITHNRELIDTLWELIQVNPLPKETVDRRLKGKRFVITGTLTESRSYYKQLIESLGGKVTDSVSKKTDYLLVGRNPGSKLSKAQKLGIQVIGEAEFEKLIKE